MQERAIVPSTLHDEEFHKTVFILFEPHRKGNDFAFEIEKEKAKEFTNFFHHKTDDVGFIGSCFHTMQDIRLPGSSTLANLRL